MKVIGILNITPDSFSDGGKYIKLDDAIAQAEKLIDDGADIIDIGAESTRPNAETISPEEEWNRLKDITKHIKKNHKIEVSIDTRNWQTAEKCLELGVDYINDVSGLSDDKMLSLLSKSTCKIIFMHSLTIPADKNVIIDESQDVIQVLKNWLQEKQAQFQKHNIARDRLIFDVGLGFGKNATQSLEMLQRIDELKPLGYPLYIGHSEKSFLTKFTENPAGKRTLETAIVTSYLAAKNINYIRVHNIPSNRQAIKIARALNV